MTALEPELEQRQKAESGLEGEAEQRSGCEGQAGTLQGCSVRGRRGAAGSSGSLLCVLVVTRLRSVAWKAGVVSCREERRGQEVIEEGAPDPRCPANGRPLNSWKKQAHLEARGAVGGHRVAQGGRLSVRSAWVSPHDLGQREALAGPRHGRKKYEHHTWKSPGVQAAPWPRGRSRVCVRRQRLRGF